MSFMTFNSLKPRVSSYISNASGNSVDIIGDIRAQILPRPKIIIEKINISAKDHQILNAEQLVLLPSITHLLRGALRVDRVEIFGGDLTIDDLQKGTNSVLKLSTVKLTNSRIRFASGSSLSGTLNNFNGTLSISSFFQNELKLNATYESGESNFSLNASVKGIDSEGNANEADLSYGNDFFNLHFTGGIKTLYKNPDFDGKAALNLKQLSQHEGYWQDLANFLLKDEKLQIAGHAKANQNEITISDIKIDSVNMRDGTANFALKFGENINLSLNAFFKHIDLDKFSSTSIDDSLTLNNFIKELLESFDLKLPANLTGNINLNVDQISYNNDNIKNLTICGDMINGEFFLSQFDSQLPGNAVFNATGLLDHNMIRPKFSGSTKIAIGDLKTFTSWLKIGKLAEKITDNNVVIQSQFSIIPRNLKFYDIKSSIGNTEITGKYMVRHSGEARLNSKLSLKINEMDFNQLNIPYNIDSVLYYLYLFDNDKSGNFFLKYTNDFAWLRMMPINLGFELEIDKVKYKDSIFQNFQSNIRFAPSNLYIDRIAFQNDAIDLDANGELALTALNPKINANVNINNLDGLAATKLIPSVKELKNFQSEYIAEYKKHNNDNLLNIENFISGDFNFFSCHNFTGNIKLNVKNYFRPDLNLQNVSFDISLVEGAINLNASKGSIFGGEFQLSGNISNNSLIPGFNLIFSLSNFNPQQFLSYFFDLNFIKGYASISGVFDSSGKDIPTFFNNLNSSIKLLGKKITISGFDISELIKLTDVNLSKQQQAEILTTYSVKGESLFDDMSGDIEIKKGIAEISGLTFKNNRVSGAYSAFIDIYNQLINGQGKMSFRPLNAPNIIDINMRHSGKIAEQTSGLDLTNLINFLKRTDNSRNYP